jgi:hypothetical protein
METNITTSQAQENEYLQAMISEPKAELAGLRKPVAEKPEHRKQYQDNLKAAMETVRPFVKTAMQAYDESIELACGWDVWTD